MTDPDRKRLRRALAGFVAALALTIGGAAVGVVAGLLIPEPAGHPSPTTAPQADAGTPPAPSFTTGWERDDDAVTAFKQTLDQPAFADTPAGAVGEDLPDHAYLWESYAVRYGRPPPVMDQNPVGSCVSFGTSRAVERSLMCEIARGAPYEFKHLVEEAVYAGSRHEIGGDRIRRDGSNGSWAARFVTTYGAIPRGTYGRYDLTKYSPARCRQWGAVGAGVPDDLEAEVRKYPVGSTTQVRTWADAKKALAQKYGIAVCSNVGFNKPGTRPGYVDPATRDARGVCRPYGSWDHCMCLDGYHTDEGGREYGHIENSWGLNAHAGPVGWGSPNTSGFWAEAGVIDRMLRQGDSWAFSAVKGFPLRKLDWNVRTPRPRDAMLTLAF